MDTKKNMSREQLLAYMRDNCTEAEAQQVRMWLRERLKDPGLDQLFSDLLDATETEYDPEGKERVRRKLDSILAACPAPNSPPRSGNLRRWRWSLRIIEYAAAVAAVVLALHYRHQANTPREWVEVYAGMVVGICSRNEDMTVNVCKKKQLTNMRASGSDDALRLVPPKQMSLEQCLEFLADDELLEVTPHALRIRKTILNHEKRMKATHGGKK